MRHRVCPRPGFNPRLPGGRRHSSAVPFTAPLKFQSTPSGGKATSGSGTNDIGQGVSIHAFRGEGDRLVAEDRTVRHAVSIHAFRGEGDRLLIAQYLQGRSFNPRLPGGRRRARLRTCGIVHVFQSTPSGGKATYRYTDRVIDTQRFNPRLPGGRRQVGVGYGVSAGSCFNPRLPGGRRPTGGVPISARLPFQSTPSGGKAT